MLEKLRVGYHCAESDCVSQPPSFAGLFLLLKGMYNKSQFIGDLNKQNQHFFKLKFDKASFSKYLLRAD